jgi:hypothetical protein
VLTESIALNRWCVVYDLTGALVIYFVRNISPRAFAQAEFKKREEEFHRTDGLTIPTATFRDHCG